MKPKFLFACSLLLLGCLSSTAYALTADNKQPAYMEADWSHLDHTQGVGSYHGHVKMTQGTTVILADTVITYVNKNNQISKAVAMGNLASYTTLPDNSKLPFSALAKTITYFPLTGQVQLVGDARATQGKDSFAGPIIYYDIKKQVVISPPTPGGHTTIILQPDQKVNS